MPYRIAKPPSEGYSCSGTLKVESRLNAIICRAARRRASLAAIASYRHTSGARSVFVVYTPFAPEMTGAVDELDERDVWITVWHREPARPPSTDHWPLTTDHWLLPLPLITDHWSQQLMTWHIARLTIGANRRALICDLSFSLYCMLSYDVLHRCRMLI